MWLTCSSIGRKFVMALTGIALVLFVTFHVLMNSVALLWPAAYNVICEFLGANWYALLASAGLALLFVIHILFAVWLTIQNRRARGNDRYAIAGAAPGVEWASKNMLVLGIVVVAFLVVHLIQFWSKMQLQELISHEIGALPVVNGAPAAPHFGTLFLQAAFENWYTPVIYIIGFVALWFHMNHGFWSMFHTIGWDNNIWLKRLKTVSCWWTTIVVLLFTAQAILFTVQAHNKFFLNDEGLQKQYAEFWDGKAEDLIKEYLMVEGAAKANAGDAMSQQEILTNFYAEKGEHFATQAKAIKEAAEMQAPAIKPQYLQQMGEFAEFMSARTERALKIKETQKPANNE